MEKPVTIENDRTVLFTIKLMTYKGILSFYILIIVMPCHQLLQKFRTRTLTEKIAHSTIEQKSLIKSIIKNFANKR